MFRRLAPAGHRSKWLTLGIWLVIGAVAGMLAANIGKIQDNDLKNWLPASAESTRALDLAQQEFSTNGKVPLLVVYARDGGLTAADRAAADADRTALAAVAADTIPPVIPAADGKALLLTVPVVPADDDTFTDVLDKSRAIVTDGLPAGLTMRLTGPPAQGADFDEAFSSLDGSLLVVTVGVVALLLLITYRSPLLLFVPLVAVGLASQLASAVVYLLSKHAGLVVNGQSAGILTVLVFGAGTDYALLIISRYREELHRHEDRHRAMAAALRHTVPAILASAATVIAALLTLLVADLNSTRGLGPVAAVGIGAALLSMTTILPALLVIFGRGLFWPFVPRYSAHSAADPVTEHKVWGRVAGAVGRRPRLIWTVTALALAALAFGTTTLDTGLAQTSAFTTKPDSVIGQELLAKHYPAGSSSPVEVYVKADRVDDVTAAVEGADGVVEVRPATVAASGQWAKLSVVLADDPGSTAAQNVVARLRDRVHAIDPATLVGGEAAMGLDQDRTMERDLRLIIPLILGVVLFVLIVLLRALVAPVLLLASVVLSFGAALGAAALIFHAIGYPSVDLSLVLNGFLFLVALGVDYTIFLMTRAREDTATHGHRAGVLRALAVTGGVITSAGVVLAATFGVLAVMPIVFMLQIGVLVAVGVLLDTLVVRSLLVPAVVLDVGRRAWWPSELAKAPAAERPATAPVRSEVLVD